MLHGALVELRALTKADLTDHVAWRNDEEVAYWATGSSPFFSHVSLEMLERTFETRLIALDKAGEYVFAIYTLDGRHIGMADYRDVDYIARAATIGLTIGDKAYWGQGYGSDATRVLVRYLLEEMNLERVQLDTWSGNVRAIKAYEKCGFQIEGRLRRGAYVRGRSYDTIIMGLLRDDLQTS